MMADPEKQRFPFPVVGYPVLGRFGLGHSLLGWARCLIWCRDNHVPMLAPDWRHLRIGPYLRRESDKRAYHRLFNYEGYIRGMQKRAYLLLGKRVHAPVRQEIRFAGRRPSVIVFKNSLGKNELFFEEIYTRHAEIRDELTRVTRTEHLPRHWKDLHFIGIHVRRGDFAAIDNIDILKSGRNNMRLPIGWYLEMLRGVRLQVGSCVPAVVCSDGSHEELQPLLNEAGVTLCTGYSAIHDILLLSKAGLLIASGSEFSMWAAFLGQVPRICYPRQRKARLLTDRRCELEPEVENIADLDQDFISYLKGVFNSDTMAD